MVHFTVHDYHTTLKLVSIRILFLMLLLVLALSGLAPALHFKPGDVSSGFSTEVRQVSPTGDTVITNPSHYPDIAVTEDTTGSESTSQEG